MIDAIALDLAPPVAIHRKSKRSNRSNWLNGAIVVGTVLILSDGSRCRVTVIDQNGQIWCVSE